MSQHAEPVHRLTDPDFRQAEAALHHAAEKAQQQAREAGLEPVIRRDPSEHQPHMPKEATMRQAIIYPGEDGFWVAECPSLPGCISQGETREEAIVNIREAIDLYVEALEADHLPVPGERFEALLVAV